VSYPPALRAYRLAARLGGLIAPAWLNRRDARGKEERDRLGERYGRATAQRPDGALVWLHGASVGESQIQLQIAAALALARPDLTLLLTSGTRTSAALIAARKPPDAIHQYLPLDAPVFVRRFMKHWRPCLGVLAESEIWPNLILSAAGRGVPLALINARMNADTLENWARRAPRSAQRLFGCFRWIGAADDLTAAGLSGLTGRHIDMVGNLKLDADPPGADADALSALSRAIGDRPVWFAASTHPGEETVLLQSHALVRERMPKALLIMAPRHPERGAAVAGEIAAAGFSVAVRSRGEPIGSDTSVYLADTLGEMGAFYRAAPVAFIAGTLDPAIGGHNPVEPALCGAALMAGPHAASFAQLMDDLAGAGALIRAETPGAIAHNVAWLLDDDAARAAQVSAAAGILHASSGAMDRTLTALSPLLPRRSP